MRQAVTDWRNAPIRSASPAERFEDVFAACQSELLGMLFYQLGDMGEARKTLQDAYVICWRQTAEGSVADNPRSWVFQVAHGAARDRQLALRRGAMRQTLASPSFDDEGAYPSRAADRETIGRLRAAIALLPSEEQEVFLLRQNGKADYEQIAASLGLPLRAVKTRMRLALDKLRKALDAG